jgi:hypothetical protein
MSKRDRLSKPVDAPVDIALVLVCEKCGKHLGPDGKNASPHLASKLKRCFKRRLERGQARAILTSCMDVCPEDRVTVVVVPSHRGPAQYCEMDVSDLDAASDAVLELVRRLQAPAPAPAA